MYIKLIYLSFLIPLLSACSIFNCSHEDNLPCGTPQEQAERLVNKLLKYPDDWICILEHEKCIDCSYYLNKISEYKDIKISNYRTLKSYHKFECKIHNVYEGILPKMETIPPITEVTRVLTVEVQECLPHELDKSSSGGLMILYLSLIHI